MSDFTKSIVYSGFVLVAGLIAIFAISNNMTTDQNGNTFAVIEPAAGDAEPFSINTTGETAAAETTEQAPWETEEALAKLREALKEAGVDLQNIEPAAGDEMVPEGTAPNTAE